MSLAKPIARPPESSPQPPEVHAQAHQLLAEADSPELAKHAVDAAARDDVAGSPGDKFAIQWGFDSYLSLFEATTPLASVGGKSWCLTAIRGGRWLLWNDADLVATVHASREDAEGQLPSRADQNVSESAGLDT